MDHETRPEGPQQSLTPANRETATGSGGLFGDLRHDKPDEAEDKKHRIAEKEAASAHTGRESTIPDQQAPQASAATHDPPPENQVSAHNAGYHAELEHFGGPMPDPTTVAGAEILPETLTSFAMVSTGQQTTDSAEHQVPRPGDIALTDEQTTLYASNSLQTADQQQTYDDIPADPEQAPPLMEAQLAEEQDLVPDVGSAQRVQRLQRLRRARDRLTYQYVSRARRSSTRPTRPLEATRQYPVDARRARRDLPPPWCRDERLMVRVAKARRRRR